ncbi:lytic transglycosylase, partial [Sulfitobacter sp.]|nr:lytic transglycosylase [Sulfitobacter sp.]
MKTPLRAMIVVLLLASCGGSSTTPPRDLDNACTILKQRPDYHKAFKAAERKWGVPVHVQMATIHQESKF